MRALLVMLIAATLAACGSTVQWSNGIDTSRSIAATRPGEALTGDDLSLSQGADASSPPRKGGQTDYTRTPSASRKGPTAMNGDGRLGMGQGTERAPSAKVGRGFNAKEIRIGYGAADDADEYASTFGYRFGLGNQSDYARIVVKDINARGGIGGRTVKLVIHNYKTADLFYRPAAAAQAACDRWTVDDPVLAVINIPASQTIEEVIGACLTRSQVPFGSGTERPARYYTQFGPYTYTPSAPTIERAMRALVARISALGYFKGWDFNTGGPGQLPGKIGLLSTEGMWAAEWESAVRNELSRHGRKVTATYRVTGNLDRKADQFAQAAVKFRRAGITHVIDQVDLFFATSVFDGQQYYPRFAVHTGNSPHLAKEYGSSRSLSGALGAGYAPARDVGNQNDPNLGAAWAQCRKIMQQAGQDTSSREGWRVMAQTCDLFNFFSTAIKKGELSPGGIGRGVRRMRSMDSAYTFESAFPDGRPDGAAAVRDLVFRKECECFGYISGNHGM